MSGHAKNKLKDLPEEIGKGIDSMQLEKVMKARRTKLVGCFLTPERKGEFLTAIEKMGLKQSEVFNIVVDLVIEKANNHD